MKISHHHRRSIRLRGFDYTSNNAYFVTICVHDRTTVLSTVVGNQVALTDYGRVVMDCWNAIPDHQPYVELDAFMIMPDHIHGILWISRFDRADDIRRGDACVAPTDRPRGPAPKSLGSIIGSFKSAVTRRINQRRDAPGMAFWQRNYHEHIIRDDAEHRAIRAYIRQNPRNWREGTHDDLWG